MNDITYSDLKNFVKQSDTIFWKTDRNGKIVFISDAVKRILGYSPNEFIGKTIPPSIPENRIDEFTRARNSLFTISPKPFKHMVRPRKHKNGEIILFEISGTPQYDEKGTFTGYLGESRKIPSSKERIEIYEKKFFSNENFWRAIIDTLPLRFFWKDTNCCYTGANTLFLKDAGLQHPSQIIGKTDFQFAKPDFAEVCHAGDIEILHFGREFFSNETSIFLDNGHKLEIIIYKSPIKDDFDNVMGVAAAYIDITSEKNKEKELKEYLYRLQKTQELVNTGYWDLNPLTGEAFWSESVYRMFGYENDEPTPSVDLFMSHVAKEDKSRVLNNIRNALTNKNFNYDITYWIVKRNGQKAYLHSKAEVIFQGDRPIYVKGVCQDITAIKQLQIENEKKQELLMRQNRLAQMGQLLNNIAHQWKQPLAELNALMLNLENDFMENKINETRFANFFESFENITSFMGETIDNFRTFLNPSSQISIVKPSLGLKKALNLLERRSKKIGVFFDIDIDESIKSYGSNQDFIHIFLVLLENAMDAFEKNDIDNPVIQIKMYQKGNTYETIIKDNGGGIDEKIVEYIFDPYFTTKFPSKGSGTGLFLVKTIVETRLQGKFVLIDSKEATFKFTLKIASI
ncbi:PAS domain S-box protein [Hydrogenimonas urashimensis]|uniref:PAS domain S-box protein n=1 Tax=Hydrogenimonas urashimensis TaxID=2740515 RepID=UPI0019164775|nr:PAS domain S-box protein [Hydrogenimonas urashimensis]